MNFEKFPSIKRFKRDIIITEKIDGTNAQVAFDEDLNMFVGSRSRWLSLDEDNYGFYRWCKEREEELRKLGPGRHFGEFWGQGINRGYDLKDRRFSLFNTTRWSESSVFPSCCQLVPVLYIGPIDTNVIEDILLELKMYGSGAAPGYNNPEGIVVYHTTTKALGKITLGRDGHKWENLNEHTK